MIIYVAVNATKSFNSLSEGERTLSMKTIFYSFLIFSLLIIATSGCRKSIHIPTDHFSVQLNKCSEKVEGAYICFDSVITDSRCPEGSECVWSGTAVVKVTFHEGGNQHQFRLALMGYPGIGYPYDTSINNYRIVFTELQPYPQTPGSASGEETIRATFSITQ